MLAKLQAAEFRYEELTEKLTDPGVIGDNNEYRKVLTEHSELSELIETYREYKAKVEARDEARALLDEPLDEDFRNVSVLAIVCRVAVPGRDVEAILHVVLLACLRKELRDVCRTAVFVAGIRNAVGGCGCGPEAEAVVVLHHCDTAVHTRSLH